MKYIARQSDYIHEDIKRNWSSWNFGNDGIHCTKQQLEEYKKEAIDTDSEFYISGFQFYGKNQINNLDIRELYKNYWVLVDTENAGGGLSCIELESENLEDAIEESKKGQYWGEGSCFDATNAKLVYSCPNNEIHIFEYED